MLKAAAWRLARLLHAKPVTLMTAAEPTLKELLEKAYPPPSPKSHRTSGRGLAERLAAKLLRLRVR